jgi:hypothetical protein
VAKPIYREVRRQITNRDNDILNFLWRWKVVSSQALARKFFPRVKNSSAHLRIRQLEEVGLVESLTVAKKQYAWGLGKKGYAHIWRHFDTEVHDGYRSDYPHHDFVATAFHLGEWLTGLPEEAEVFSEQELKSHLQIQTAASSDSRRKVPGQIHHSELKMPAYQS